MAGAKQVARHAGTHTAESDETNLHTSKDNRPGGPGAGYVACLTESRPAQSRDQFTSRSDFDPIQRSFNALCFLNRLRLVLDSTSDAPTFQLSDL
jgi:hypothetical protein